MSLNVQRTEIIQTLRNLQNFGFESAIIAGGYVRDHYFNQTPRDVDIFIQNPNYSNEKVGKLGDHLQNMIWTAMKCSYDATGRNPAPDKITKRYEKYKPNKDGSNRITHVYDVTKNWIPFQVILTKIPPVEYVNKYFDFGICRCYCDGVKMRYTPAFMEDMHNRTLTLMSEDMTEKEVTYALNNHLPRLLWRFPNYTVKFTPEVKQIVDKIRNKP